MSHYTVAVFSKRPEDVDELLEPFNENSSPASPYMEFVESADEDFDEDAQKHGYWHNPQAYWDWWEIGGRWHGMLRLKKGATGRCVASSPFATAPKCKTGTCDQALVTHCDFTPDEKEYKWALRFWEVIVEGAEREEGEPEYTTWLVPQYYIDKYGTKERFAEHHARFTTYAFVRADGEWVAPGRVGFFGSDDSTKDSQEEYDAKLKAYLTQAAEEGLYITIVDCHI